MSNKQKVLNEVKRLIELGNSKFSRGKINFNKIEIRFTLWGKVAGKACYINDNDITLWFHPQLMERNINEYIRQTVGHEVAHLFQKKLYPLSNPHGQEFKRVARALGNSGLRCHTLDTSGIGKAKKRYEYRCPKCGKIYMITPYKHNRQQDKNICNGKYIYSKYICSKDRTRIIWTGNVTIVR
jgi:SprT protein